MEAGNWLGIVVDSNKVGIVVDFDMSENLEDSGWNWVGETEQGIDVEMVA